MVYVFLTAFMIKNTNFTYTDGFAFNFCRLILMLIVTNFINYFKLLTLTALTLILFLHQFFVVIIFRLFPKTNKIASGNGDINELWFHHR